MKAARAVRRRFMDHFGPLNQRFSLAGHNFVVLDAPGLVEEDYHRSEHGVEFANLTASPGGAMEFAQRLGQCAYPSNSPLLCLFLLRSQALTVIFQLLDGLTQPTVLFTHIPLARPELASCGPLREHGIIRRGVGAGYQNTMGKRTTHFLLKDVHPVIVFRCVMTFLAVAVQC